LLKTGALNCGAGSKFIFMKLGFNTFLILLIVFFTDTAMAQNLDEHAPNAHFRVYTARGKPSNLDEITKAMQAQDVVFIGEEHDDPTAHALELELLRRAYTQYGAAQSSPRAVALSLEMFERDVQTVLDEYAKNLITEPQFLEASRPWNNYRTDYRPLVEFARANQLPIIAANAPRRYVNRVSRLGRAALDVLSPTAKSWLAPLPYAEASPAYARKFMQLMGAPHDESPIVKTSAPQTPHAMQTPHANLKSLLDAQSLWDATMAYSIAEQLKRAPNSLVVQVNGKFHSQEHLGMPEHLARYHPGARSLVVTIISDEHFDGGNLRGAQQNAGDFVILTDASLPRTRQ
jgi:uncharacterized iron-regulated protein